MNIVTNVGTSIIDAGSKGLGVISGLSTGTLAIGSGVSLAVTALSVGLMVGGKAVYCKHTKHNDDNWKKTAFKLLGMSMMIGGGLLGLASSAATGMFSAFSLSAFGTMVLGPIGTKVGVIAGIALGVAAAVTVTATFVKCVKSAVNEPDVKNGAFGRYKASDNEEYLE